MPPPQWIFHELLQKNSTALLYGPSNLGKSFVALEMLFALATGRDDVFKPMCKGRALYITGEGVAGLSIRLLAWERARLTILPERSVAFVGTAVQIADPKARRQFITAIRKEFGDELPDLIIFDTLARCAVGLDENSAKDMGILVEGLEQIRQDLKCSVLLVHHSTKSDPKTERGSGVVFGAVDTALALVQDGAYLELQCPKQKNGHRAPPHKLYLKKCHGSCVLDANVKKVEEGQLEKLQEILTVPGTKRVSMAKRDFIRDAFPPRPWNWDGKSPVCAVDVIGGRVHLEQVKPSDPHFKAWLAGGQKVRQRSADDQGAEPFAYLCESPEYMAADEAGREEILEQRRQFREDRFGGRSGPWPAVDDLELAWWLWGAVELGVTQSDISKWYEIPRSTVSKLVQTWKKFGLLPPTNGAGTS